MPRSSAHPLSAIAYGSGSTPQPQPDWRTSFTPPPNRLQHIEYTREASLERKIQSAALAETLLLDWLQDQSLNTVSSQLNLGELNRATRILYRLTAIQKSLTTLHADIHGPRRAPDPTPDPDPPLEPLDDDADDDDDDPDPALLTGSADVPSAPANADQPAPPSPSLGPRTAPSATSPMPANSATLSPDTPQSAICNSQSPIRNLSVRAVPTLPLDQVESILDGIDADLARLPGITASDVSSGASPEPPPSIAHTHSQANNTANPSPPLPDSANIQSSAALYGVSSSAAASAAAASVVSISPSDSSPAPFVRTPAMKPLLKPASSRASP